MKTRSRNSAAQSAAWITLERNLDSLAHMISFGKREIERLRSAAKRVNSRLSKSDEASAKVQLVTRFLTKVGPLTDRLGTANLWQVVILVTCVETYLQDILAAAAGLDPELLKESQQSATYASILAATSLEELVMDLRRRWARGWLEGGGPTRWISRLEKMGVRDYPIGLAPRLELIWGIRHVVVHAAGVATPDFLKRHPGAAAAVGDRVVVKTGHFFGYLSAAQEFLEPTEQYFLARWPSLIVPLVKTVESKVRKSKTRKSKARKRKS